MEEGAYLGHLSYRPALGLGISAPPCFRVLFGKVQQCSIRRDQTTGDLKSHYLQAGVTAISVPPSSHPFFQQYMKKSFLSFLRALLASSGGHVPLRPPLGPALALVGNPEDRVSYDAARSTLTLIGRMLLPWKKLY